MPDDILTEAHRDVVVRVMRDWPHHAISAEQLLKILDRLAKDIVLVEREQATPHGHHVH